MQGTSKKLESLGWNDIAFFRMLYREGSLPRAAAKMNVDPSTISRRIALLEEALSIPLFDRSREGFRATDYAKKLIDNAEEMQRSFAGLLHEAEAFETQVAGTVRLTLPPGLSDAFVAGKLQSLLVQYPNLSVELDARVGVLDLANGEADLAIRTLKPEGDGLLQKRLLRSQGSIFASREYAKELGIIDSLDGTRLIQWGRELEHMQPAKWLEKHRGTGRIVLRTSSMISQAEAARNGVGIWATSSEFAKIYDLVEVRMGPSLRKKRNELATNEIWLISHRTLRKVPRVAAVWDHLVESFGK